MARQKKSSTLDNASRKNLLVGAWLIKETSVTTTEGTSTDKNPPPGIYIFTDQHFSNTLIPKGGERLPFTDRTTPEEMLAAYNNFIAEAGSYEVTESTLTTHNIVAKIPNYMNGRIIYQYKLEGDSLRLLLHDDGWAPEGGKILYHLVRMK